MSSVVWGSTCSAAALTLEIEGSVSCASKIAGLVLAAVGVLGSTAVPASAVVKPVCLAEVNRPCAWRSQTPDGTVGGGLIDAPDTGQLTMLRVEVRIERAWGSPWETVAEVSSVRTGSIRLTTPPVTTHYLTMVCATGGPAEDPDSQTTTCRF